MPAAIPGKGNNTLTSAWADIWRVYEDACVLCAGLWMGSWRNGSFYSSSRQRGDWGAIHLEGDDDLSIRRKRDESYVYVRNLGMGIEGRPTSTRSPSENGTLHNRSHRHQRRTSAMSLWTWASGRTPNEVPGTSAQEQEEEEDETIDELNRRQERQIITTLALLQVFHRHTSQLLTRFTRLLPGGPTSDSASEGSSKSTVTLSPKDVMSVELGPLSTLDARFVEWLAEEYGNGAKVVVKRGWRDLIGMVLGFG